MRILQLDIVGFRSLKQISWKPGDLNVVIGANGTGKSNLLRFLELMSISAQFRLLGKHIQSLGGMEPIAWDGRATSISFKLKASPVHEKLNVKDEGIIYELELARLGKGSSYKINSELLSTYSQTQSDKQSKPALILKRSGSDVWLFDQEEQAMMPRDDLQDERYLEKPESETYLSIPLPIVDDPLMVVFRHELASWAIYHDMLVHKDAIIRQAAVARVEKRVEPDGQNLIPVLHTLYTDDRDFKKEINTAMRAAFGGDFDELVFPPAADQRVQLRIRWKSLKREQSAADLSDGTLRFLLLLTILASPSPPPLIAIDEPETGLHPSMFPIIAEYAVDAASRTQVIFTTHSPQFLDAFTDTKPTTSIVKWENGETTLKVLNGEELDYWLEEYTLGALFKSGELEGMG
ncbi:MAG: AAA family ATPase [bacterium]